MSITHEDGGIKEDVIRRIYTGWLKLRSAFGGLWYCRLSMKPKGKCYGMAVRSAMHL